MPTAPAAAYAPADQTAGLIRAAVVPAAYYAADAYLLGSVLPMQSYLIVGAVLAVSAYLYTQRQSLAAQLPQELVAVGFGPMGLAAVAAYAFIHGVGQSLGAEASLMAVAVGAGVYLAASMASGKLAEEYTAEFGTSAAAAGSH